MVTTVNAQANHSSAADIDRNVFDNDRLHAPVHATNVQHLQHVTVIWNKQKNWVTRTGSVGQTMQGSVLSPLLFIVYTADLVDIAAKHGVSLHAFANDCTQTYPQCESKKIPPKGPDIFHFIHKQLRICNWFFTHLLNVPIFARVQIFIQLSPILTKLCHIKRYYPVHIICAKCPKRPKTRAFRRLRKSLIALLIVVCDKSL